jgi:SAM-dependent methyltransferase
LAAGRDDDGHCKSGSRIDLPGTTAMTDPLYIADDPATYERQMGRWSSRLAELFVEFAKLGNPVNVLDVGCGTGSLSFAVANSLPEAQLTGVDLSGTYVAYARSRCADARLTFEQSDATALGFPDGSFDAVVSLLALNFVPDAKLAVAQACRVVRPGGVVAAAVWDFRGGLTSCASSWIPWPCSTPKASCSARRCAPSRSPGPASSPLPGPKQVYRQSSRPC